MMLYTFDVFDTLITRIWLRPSDVFLHTALLLERSASLQVSPDDWVAARRAAERRLRQRIAPREVTISEIYAELAQELGWNQPQTAAALALELDCERRALRPILPMAGRVRALLQKHCKVAVVSDFYVCADFVSEMLQGTGIPVERADVLVSCDERCTKRSGALFNTVIKRYRVAAEQICHTGDHPVSDNQQAKRAGLSVTPYLHSAPLPTELLLGAWGDSAGERLISAGIAGAARRARIDRELQDRSGALWRVATAVAGPLLFGYVYWILTQARERGLRRLYFLARDGQILLRIAERIARSCGMDLELRYLHASRRAWFLPSVAFGSAQERAAAVLTDPEVSIDTLLSSLEVQPARVQDCLEAVGLPRSAWHRPVPVERLRGLLCAAPFDGLLQERAVGEYALCMEYLTGQGMFDPVAKAIVDVGWKGRLQTALARLSRSINAPLPSGFYLALRERPAAADVGVTEVYLEGADAMVLNPSLTELLSAADHGSTLGYEQPAGQPARPVLAAGVQPALEWGIREFQEGTLAFTANMLEVMQTLQQGPLLEETPQRLVAALRECSLAAMRRLVSSPSAEEAALLGSFPHMHDQFHGVVADLAPRLSISTFLKGFLRPATLDKFTHWHQGSLVRSLPRLKVAPSLWRARVRGIPRIKAWLRSTT